MLGSLILINSLVGAGILNLPYSVHAAGGILSALCIQMVNFLLFFSFISFKFSLSCVPSKSLSGSLNGKNGSNYMVIVPNFR